MMPVATNHQGYTATNTFKDARYVVTNLIDIVSKNGNLLLNIGPKSDGTITDQETAVLLGTGKWLDVNGDAIYATRPPGKFMVKNLLSLQPVRLPIRKNRFTWRDVRFTTKGDVLYVTTLGLPDRQLDIKALSIKSGNGKIAEIKMLGSDQKVA